MRPHLATLGLLTACSTSGIKTALCANDGVCVVAGTGELGFNGDEHPALETRLASPTSVREGPNGELVIVDFSNMRVRYIDSEGAIVTRIGDGFHAYSEPGLSPTDSPLENPIDVAWHPDGRLCVLPLHEGRVICINDDDQLERYAGTGGIADSGDDGPALDAEMGFVSGLAFSSDGTLFISDSTHSRIRRVSPTGVIDTVLGTGQAGLGPPGFGPDMMIRFPERLAIDETTGRLIIADTYNHRVLELDTDSLEATILAGTGEAGWSGDGDSAETAELNTPVGVAVAPDGGTVIADTRNFVIRHISPEGTIETIAGTGAYELTEESAARLSFNLVGPSGISWTESGDLLVAEQYGHRILRLPGLWDAL